jgi:hypothetical protein
MELRTRYKIFKIVTDGGGLPGPKTVMRPIGDGANTFDSEHDAIQWIQEREPQERYTEFIVLTTYSME